MLVSFNAYKPNTNFKVGLKNNTKPQSFTSLRDGRIVAEEIAKYANAEKCANFIFVGGYKPTVENLNALNKAKEIAAKDKSVGASIIAYLNDAIELLVEKMK